MASQNPEFSSHLVTTMSSVDRLKRMRPALGTFCSIEAAGDGIDIGHAINDAFGAIHRVNDLMHPLHGMDLARINQSSLQSIKIDEWTWHVLHLAKQLHEASNGIFDPCVPTAIGRMSDIELLPDNHLICHVPLSLDLGGIAKGFAVDCAINALKASGCSSGLVNAGGDMRVFGEPQWMQIQHAGQWHSIELNDQALAVSEKTNAARPAEHRGYYSRAHAQSLRKEFVAIAANKAVVADAVTKCLMWATVEDGAQLCRHFDAQLMIAI